MLEFFAASFLAEHLCNKKNKEDSRYENFNMGGVQLNNDSRPMDMNGINLVAGIVALVIAILTARLAYDCNKKSDPALRILASLFGFFFSGAYLLYYFLKYILLGGKC